MDRFATILFLRPRLLKWGVVRLLPIYAWLTPPGWFQALTATLATAQALLCLGRREVTLFNLLCMFLLANAAGWALAGLAFVLVRPMPQAWYFVFLAVQGVMVATQDIR